MRGRQSGEPQDVLVVGASLAGLFAAAAASGAGRRVTLLERDVLPDAAQPRPGVPQGQQPHVFLCRGLLAAEELLPGLRADLLARGAVPFDTGDLPWLGEFGWLPVGRRAFEVLSATRPLFEQVVRGRVLALPGVTLRTGARVAGVRRSDGRWLAELSDGSQVAGDVLVDASGRGSRLPVWLAAMGVAPGRPAEVDARVGYATRMYAAGPDLHADPGVVVAATPQTPAGGLALPVGGGRWQVLAVGMGERRPPRDAAGFEAFLGRLRDPALRDLVGRCTPTGDVAAYRQTGNRRHRYERVRGWPDGLLVVGDGLCALNPVYGQGIAVAACQGLLLRDRLAGCLRPGGTRGLLRRLAATSALPWAIATGEDLRHPTSSGTLSRPRRAFSAWTRELGRLGAHGDGRAVDALSAVYHLMASPRVLFDPRLVAAVLRARLTGYGPPVPRPATLDALAPSPGARRITSTGSAGP